MTTNDRNSNPQGGDNNDDRSTGGGRGPGRGGYRHGGRGGRGGRGAGRSGNPSGNSRKKVEGGTKELGTNVFQLYAESRDRKQYERTKNAIEHYVRLNLTKGNDIVPTIKHLKVSTLKLPDALVTKEDKEDPVKKRIFEKKVDAYVKREEQMEDNLQTLYSIVWNQCSKQVKMQVKAAKDYDTKSKECDSLWLLKTIKGICYSFQEQKNKYIAIDKAKTAIYAYAQGAETSLADYQKEFLNMIDVLEHYGGSFGNDPGLIKETMLADTSKTREQAATAVREEAIVTAFLLRANNEKYGDLLVDLENQFSLGTDQYPNTLGGAYTLLANYKPRKKGGKPGGRGNGRPPGGGGGRGNRQTEDADAAVSFMMVKGTDGILHKTVTCYHCNQPGHYAGQCPGKGNTGDGKKETTLTQVEDGQQQTRDNDSIGEVKEISFMQVAEVVLAQSTKRSGIISKNWILLDSESSISVFCNKKFLTNIRHCGEGKGVRVHSNGGHQDSVLIGDLKNYGPVWYNENSLANILSLSEVTTKCRVTMDSAKENALVIHKQDGSTMKFMRYKNGLYYYDASKNKLDKNKQEVNVYSFLSTVQGNKANFTRREIEGAEKARELMWDIGYPSEEDFEYALANGLVRNCPLTVADAKRAIFIWGPDLGSIQGKKVRKPPSHVPDEVLVPLPSAITLHHMNITLCMDFFYVNGNAFYHTISRKIQFRTVQPVQNRSKRTIETSYEQVKAIYTARGFSIARVHGDNEFECIRLAIMPTQLHIAAPGEHVPEVERSVRTTKERVRATTRSLPYNCYPRILIRGITCMAVFNLNLLPSRNGISRVLSPRNIVPGLGNLDYRKIKIRTGAYAQVHTDNTPTNTQKSRTVGAIALYRANENGSWYFMSLATGERIHSNNWVVLPITDEVINSVNQRGRQEGQPVLRDGVPIFEWRRNVPIEDDDEEQNEDERAEENDADMNEMPFEEEPRAEPDNDHDNADEDNEANPDETNDAEDANPTKVENEQDDHENDREERSVENNEEERSVGSNEEERSVGSNEEERSVVPETIIEGDEETVEPDMEEQTIEDPGEDHDNDEPEVENADTVNVGGYGLRGNRGRDYGHRFGFLQAAAEDMEENIRIDDEVIKQCYEEAVNICFTQMTAEKGIKTYGKKAVEAIFKEFAQLDDLKVFGPLKGNELTREQRRSALRAIVLVKEKRCGKIKGRTVADGRPQKKIYSKDETASPTVSLEALLLSLMVDAKEGRDVATADVGGAYLHGKMDDFVILKMVGNAVDIMCEVNESYKEYVVIKKGQRVLYLQLLKALYRCMKAALIWYTLFVTVLQGMGFILNPYDKCIANKEIENSQCTVAWYVDDNKISHLNPSVVTDVLNRLENRFGKLSITRGKQHTFLGMDIDFIEDEKVQISMTQYVLECIEAYGLPEKETAASPARNSLFEIDESSPRLQSGEDEKLHSIVAKLLYISNRARPDILLPVAFLCTRVQKPTEQDRSKLRRVLQYLNGTKELCLTLRADDLSRMHAWVDSSFAVHVDSKGHTGGGMSLGYGVILPKSVKQKLNTKSSTECELVGASDYLPNMVWARMFYDAQQIAQNEGTFYQDNMSTIRFEKNGRNSCGSKSKHIHNRYFWIKDRLESENIKVIHCPTAAMLADFLTKPLQGALFRKFRDVLLGYKHFSTLLDELGLPPRKERVGGNEDLGDNEKSNNGREKIRKIHFEKTGPEGQRVDETIGDGQRVGGMTYAQVLMKKTTKE